MKTELDEMILSFIRAYIDRKGYPPTQREIAAACYLSRSGVILHLKKLQVEGRISRVHGVARGITIRELDAQGS